jgi:hypothetical protein
MNKNHYNRYISQTDPKKHQEYQDHLEKIRKYRTAISEMTDDFLDNPDKQVTTEVNEAFDLYVRTLIRHFECKKMENSEKDEDVLFGEVDNELEKPPVQKSFWGKHKVLKRTSSIYPMNYIPRIPET